MQYRAGFCVKNGIMKKEENFYFGGGMNFHAACAGHEVKNTRLIQNIFRVALTARDGMVTVCGEAQDVDNTISFFEELAHFFSIRGRQLDQRDFELLCKAFRDKKNEGLRELWSERIQVSPKKRDVLPRSRHQMEYVRAIREHDMVFGIGPAGTGKTYLAMALAVSSFLKGESSRIILTRPARESGENLGFLPGSLEDKINPYLRPLYDALYDMMPADEASAFMERGVIEVAPLAFMRGRTLANSFIILDEAQNTTTEQMLMFLTRMGFSSKVVVTGDPTQADLKPNEKSGLIQAVNTLGNIPEIAFCRFSTDDVVRHMLLEKIINAYAGKDRKQDV